MTRPATVLLGAGILALAAGPAFGQVSSPRRDRASQGDIEGLRLVIGGGLEFASDSDESEMEFPLTLEYNFQEDWKFVLESSYIRVNPKDPAEPSSSSIGDLETFLEGEILSERRYRPALTIETGVKWGTADAPDFGSGEIDYALGLIASKEFEGWDADLGAVYSWIGSSPGLEAKNLLELSLGAEVELSETFALIGEGVYSIGGDSTFRRGGGLGGGLAESGGGFEYAVGFGIQLSDSLKAETGVGIQADGAWQGIVYLEWDFSGEG